MNSFQILLLLLLWAIYCIGDHINTLLRISILAFGPTEWAHRYCWLHELSDRLAAFVLFWGEFWSVKFLKTSPLLKQDFISRKFCFCLEKMMSAIGLCTTRSRFCCDGSLLSPRFLETKSSIGLCAILLICILQQLFDLTLLYLNVIWYDLTVVKQVTWCRCCPKRFYVFGVYQIFLLSQ